jgi:hypothetical protein
MLMDNILITTTVSLDCAGNANQIVIHLVQGDYGTRALRLIPVLEGRLMNMEEAGVVRAKVALADRGVAGPVIDCELGDCYATMVPTKGMMTTAREWAAELILLNEENGTVRSMPFTLIVHETVYKGNDTVEYTNSRVTSAEYDEQGRLTLEELNGEKIVAGGLENLIAALREELADYLLTPEDRADLTMMKGYLNQSVKTDASPEFAGLKVGTVEISAGGEISGAIFT